jgi:hypothetical protein
LQNLIPGIRNGVVEHRSRRDLKQHPPTSPAPAGRWLCYAGFHHLFEGGRIVEAACWAHVRRKFYDIHVANGSAIAADAVKRIGAAL